MAPARLSTKLSSRPSPELPLDDVPPDPKVEAAICGRLLMPGKRFPTSFVAVGRVFWKRPPL